jgi:Ni/Fe-hydrogenase subunit HybB-like protein
MVHSGAACISHTGKARQAWHNLLKKNGFVILAALARSMK